MGDEFIKWRREFHKNPELEFNVDDTAKKVADLLQSFGLEVHQKIGISGIVGVLKSGKSKKSIGLRADMDALAITEQNSFEYKSQNAGKMHACGHDGHMAMLLASAKILAQKPDFDGTVYFIFQPNEEHGTGAQAMIDDGLFEKFPMDAVYGMHNMPGIEAGVLAMKSGAIMAAEDSFTIKIKGKGGHSSQPQNCIDAIVVGSNIITQLQKIAAPDLEPPKTAVVSVTDFKVDGTTNVIAGDAVITGDCRSFSEEVQDNIATSMENIVDSVCKEYGADYEFNYKKLFYPTINSEQETQAARQAALKVNGADKVVQNCSAMAASEDFASMLRVKPGAYIFIGNGLDSKGGCMLHNAHYDFNDDILQTGADYWVELVKQELC